MKRPSKKDIKAAIDKLKDAAPSEAKAPDQAAGKLSAKQSSKRIRKQGTV